jgi:hypothetical protein
MFSQVHAAGNWSVARELSTCVIKSDAIESATCSGDDVGKGTAADDLSARQRIALITSSIDSSRNF